MDTVKSETEPLRLSEPTAERLIKNKNEIFTQWEELLRDEVPSTALQSSAALRNTLPEYLDELAKWLEDPKAESISSTKQTTAREHGKQRYDLGRYTLEQILFEYRLLLRTVLKILRHTGRVTAADSDRVVDYIQEGMAQAAHEFVDLTTLKEKRHLSQLEVEQDLREHFVSSLTHDLRNPLTAMKSGAQLILRKSESRDAVETLAMRIITSADRAEKMIQDLLDTNRISAGEKLPVQFENTNLSQLVNDEITELSSIYGARFVENISKDVQGKWSSKELRRALGNLLVNAVKYGDPKTKVTIKATASENSVCIQVHNSGNPIPVIDQKRIFQRYSRLDHAEATGKKGWGLGLTLVRGVAEAHHGDIRVESNSVDGTTFILTLPKIPNPVA